MAVTEHTSRGFARVRFRDHYGTDCSIQKSSLADTDAIWFGADEIGLKRFVPNSGWVDVPTPSESGGVSHVANNRIHLTREQVAALLPILHHFVDAGEVRGELK